MPRQEVAYAEAGGRLYLAGGLEDLGLSFLSDRHERFDPATGVWRRLAALPGPANHLAAVEYGGRVYYLGGLEGFPFAPTGAVWIYDPATGGFSAGARMPAGRERGAAAVALHRDRIYVAGGQRRGAATSEFDVYDPVADAWSALPDLPRAREHAAAVVAADRLYVVGGRTVGGPVAHTDAYDFATRRWIAGLAPMPTPRGGLAAALVGDEIVTMGGETPEGGSEPAHAEVESYEPAADAWRRLAPMPVGRHGIQAAVLDGAVWLAGGADVAGLGPVDHHTAAIPAFAPVTVSALRIAPSRFRPAATGPMLARRGRGARVSFTADGATRATFTVTGPRGTRGSVRRRVPAGTSRLRLTGRLRGRALRPGRYRLEVKPAGGAPARARFRIARG